jgi:hypothetical protein
METIEKKLFDGIILPFEYLNETAGLGTILGITSHELAGCPREMVVNVAVPKPKELSNMVVYWLDNCPEGNGPWSKRACAYWLMPRFSNLHENDRVAIRVKPADLEKDKRDYNQDFIFWVNGKPVGIGHQYQVGLSITRSILGGGRSLGDVVETWQQKAYDLRFSDSIGDFESKIGEVLRDFLMVKLIKTKRGLEIDSRNAGWKSQYPLVESVV